MAGERIITTPLIIDVETTTDNNGNPYDPNNKLCLVGFRHNGDNHIFDVEYIQKPIAETIEKINLYLDTIANLFDTIVSFNSKFDLAWLRQYDIRIPADGKTFWDCQLAHFIHTNQSVVYPSLDKCCEYYGIPGKLDVVDREYWSKGIDTPEIPLEVLMPYLETDLEITEKLFQRQLETISKSKSNLIKLHNQDLLILLDMEYNGIRFDLGGMEDRLKKTQSELQEVESRLNGYIEWEHFNWDSGDHLSCLLYGGTITVDVPHSYEHTYKSGIKAGQIATRYHWETVVRTYPRLIEPLPKSELKKEGYWSVDESVLRQLKPKIKSQRELIGLIKKRSELSKLIDTYLIGLRKKYDSMNWENDLIHGKFNQVVARTGRLSSSDPNLQNLDPIIHEYIISRF